MKKNPSDSLAVSSFKGCLWSYRVPIGSAFIISAVMEVVKQTFQFAKQNGKHLSCFGFFFFINLSHSG